MSKEKRDPGEEEINEELILLVVMSK